MRVQTLTLALTPALGRSWRSAAKSVPLALAFHSPCKRAELHLCLRLVFRQCCAETK